MNNADLVVPEFNEGDRLFNRFQLVRRLGSGGIGMVWLARNLDRGEDVALKLLPPLLAHDASLIEDLLRERDRSSAHPHPGVAALKDVVHDGTLLGVVMEFVPGEPISRRREQMPGRIFEPIDLEDRVSDVCAALDFMHTHGRVHGGIHPGCLQIDRSDHVRILGFGVARALADSARRADMGERIGSLACQSPQRLAGNAAMPADDIFALGATLYELLAGRPPALETGTPLTIAAQRAELGLSGEPVPAAWESAISACLATEPTARPPSAGKLMEMLGSAATTSPAPARTAAPPPASEPEPPRHPRTRREWAYLALTVICAVGAVILLVKILTAPPVPPFQILPPVELQSTPPPDKPNPPARASKPRFAPALAWFSLKPRAGRNSGDLFATTTVRQEFFSL